jgi:serine/threonine protein kinase
VALYLLLKLIEDKPTEFSLILTCQSLIYDTNSCIKFVELAIAMATQQKDCIFEFKTIDLLKEQILGIGSYGQVCKARCDNLICAAKILHQNIFDPKAQHKTAHKRTHIAPIRKFEQEIEILRTVKHPNIVQYLGMYQDSDTGVPVLLMELMDESLTTFLGGSSAQVPFHTQVNICHDVSQALAFLHSNSIIHRDLSSNNVLLIGDARAKLSDFGMAKLTDHMNGFSASCTLTKNPGSDAYMPPEAAESPAVYTEKLDCFSFGVLIVQILTQKLPSPEDPYEQITNITALKCDQSRRSFQRISEIRRRQNHINEISSGHPLLSIALDCLKDVDIERPSSAHLCETVRALKGDTTYKESARRRNHHQQETEIQEQSDLLEEKDYLLVPELRRENLELKQQLAKAKDQAREYDKKIVAIDQEMKLLKQKYEASEQARLEVEKRLQELKIRTQHSEGPMSLRLIWREGHKLPREISKGCDPVVRDNVVFFKPASNIEIYAYDTIQCQWSQLPNCLNSARCCSLAVIKNQLTTIGGCQHPDDYSNELFSLTEEPLGHDKCTCSWTKEFPPMKTRRCNTITLCTEEFLIVAGGVTTDRKVLKTVEVMNLDTQTWSVVADIPSPLYSASLVMNEDRLYMVGGSDKDGDSVQTVFRCSLTNLLPRAHGKQPSKRGLKKVWKARKIPDIPVTDTTCVLIQGCLLTIGGILSWNDRTTDAVHAYDPFKSRWITVSHMSLPRSECFVAYLPEKNEVLVAGGYTENSVVVSNLTDHVEVAIAIT